MVKKENETPSTTSESTIELTVPETVSQAEVTETKPKTKAKKTKSETTKKTATKSTKMKTTIETKEVIKEVIKEVVKIVTPEVYLQVAGFEFSSASFAEQAREAWIASGHDENEINSLKVYIKPEDNAVYYVVNETETGKFEFKLEF